MMTVTCRDVARDWFNKDDIVTALKNNNVSIALHSAASQLTGVREEIFGIFAESGIDILDYITTIPLGLFAGLLMTNHASYSYPIFLKEFIIPDNITGIGYKAFYLNQFYSSIIIGRNVKWIGEKVFYHSHVKTLMILSDSKLVKFDLMYLDYLTKLVSDPSHIKQIDYCPRLREWFIPHKYLHSELDMIAAAVHHGKLPNLKLVKWTDYEFNFD